MTDVVVCENQPIVDRRVLSAVRAYRASSAFAFVGRGVRDVTEPLPPVDNFLVCFGVRPDDRVRERVQSIFRDVASALAANEIRCERGFIYVFHDSGDPPNVLKIGRTRRTPTRRLAEWERQLAPEPGKSLRLLSAYATSANRVAERVIHELLRCQRIANRINPIDNNELDEFFTVDNLLALALFIRETLRYIDAFCADFARIGQRVPAR
jgi:hypothetical protein